MIVRAALAAAANALVAVSDTPRLDAELLMAHVLRVERDALLLRYLDATTPEGFAALVERRLAHEPIAYITGTRDFWSITLKVGPGVLIPRPDSETLIEAAVAHFAGTSGPTTIVDPGTGPGTLLLAALAEWPEARGLGIDASAAALDYARANAAALGMAERANFVRGDWLTGIDARFDLILCNPPYIGADEPLPPEVAQYEPGEALFSGSDGLADYRLLAPQIAVALAPGGVAAIEIGWTQAAAVAALFAAQGLAPHVRRDLGGRDRAVIVQHA